MRTIAHFLLFCGIFFFLESKEKKRIVLNMIVKDEEKVIERCLSSVKDIIDYWVIVDTGSTDKTIDVIKKFFKEKPGEIHSRPWVDFAYNRQEALDFARTKGDYILFMDADDTLTFEKGFEFPELNLDFYAIYNTTNTTQWLLPRIVNAKLPWKWTGVLHECISCEFDTKGDFLDKVHYNYLGGGARSQDPKRIDKDIQVLKEGLLKEPLNRRYLYDLARTCESGNRYEEALDWYKKRALYPGEGDPEEVFLSLFSVAKMQQKLQMNSDLVLESYFKAYEFFPSRLEPLFYILLILSEKNQVDEAYDLAKKALVLPKRKNFQFIDKWIEDYGILLIYAELCLKKGFIKEAVWALRDLQNEAEVPEDVKKIIEKTQNEIISIPIQKVHMDILSSLKKVF